jgi:hypothetical protein
LHVYGKGDFCVTTRKIHLNFTRTPVDAGAIGAQVGEQGVNVLCINVSAPSVMGDFSEITRGHVNFSETASAVCYATIPFGCDDTAVAWIDFPYLYVHLDGVLAFHKCFVCQAFGVIDQDGTRRQVLKTPVSETVCMGNSIGVNMTGKPQDLIETLLGYICPETQQDVSMPHFNGIMEKLTDIRDDIADIRRYTLATDADIDALFDK